MKYKIGVDGGRCMGCGTCAAVCDNFSLVGGKSTPREEVVEGIGCNGDARDMCPVEAIFIGEARRE